MKQTEFLEAELEGDKTYFVAIGTRYEGYYFVPIGPTHEKWEEQMKALGSGCLEGKTNAEVDAWIEEERFRTELYWSRFETWRERNPEREPLTAGMGI